MSTSSEHPDWTTTGFSTRAIHAGQDPDATTGAVVPPIHQVSTYKQDGVGGLRGGYEYSRSANPTRTALEEALAAAESGGLGPTADGSPAARGFAFASGLAAEDTLLRAVVRPGDHVIVPDDAYGGTYRLIARVFGPWGVEHTPVDLTDVEAVRAAVRPETRVVWVETPTNPLLGVSDIAALAGVAHDAGALLVVDNTFATPYLQQPLALGADVVVHSTTKYVGGHSDVVGERSSSRRVPSSPAGSRRPRAGATSPGRSASTRTRPAPSPGRSTRGSRCAASRPSRCAWTATRRTPPPSPTSSPPTPRSPR